MKIVEDEITWQESMNDVTIDCSLDVKIHPAKDSKLIFLIIPGVDGDVDGYENKYIKIAESVKEKHNVAVVRISNPFISSFFWESNVRQALNYIRNHCIDICGNEDYEIIAQGHSAGASVIASIAHEYPEIKKILVINTAMRLREERILDGIDLFKGDTVVVFGELDPSVNTVTMFSDLSNTKIITKSGADHFFSGEAFNEFVHLANKYLFEEKQ